MVAALNNSSNSNSQGGRDNMADMIKLLTVWNLKSLISLDPYNSSLNRCHFSYLADKESNTKSITTKPHHLLRSTHMVNTQTDKSKSQSLFKAWHEPCFLGGGGTSSRKDPSLPIWPTDRCLNC